MTQKIFRSIFLVAGLTLLISSAIILGYLHPYFASIQAGILKDQLQLAEAGVTGNGAAYLESIRPNRYRITWVAADGTVLYDTAGDARQMENHLEREEIRAALESGAGQSTRYSRTLLEKTTYQARRLPDGTVLRLSADSATAGRLVLGILQPVLVILAVALMLSAILAGRLAGRIVKPLNQLDLDRPLDQDAYEELSPLLNRINRQNLKISAARQALRQKADEFAQITDGMNEGLILLDEAGTVLQLNPAAARLFDIRKDCTGLPLLTVCRDHDIQQAIRRAFESGHVELRRAFNGRTHQLDISRIVSGNTAAGAVLLIFDITERVEAERSRREFTANVSHELKTPLQSIIGSAELIENGLVQPEDLPRFVGRIRTESLRLLTLVEDIIRLSQLDGPIELQTEAVDLLDLAERTAETLRTAAAARSIDIRTGGEHVVIKGVRPLLSEIIANLCDNAVKYNRGGGLVELTVGRQADKAVLTVSDTGIGIPEAHIGRIFERFYRVDGSHARSTGGTGLGLSIVKHAVAHHRGRIEVESDVGKGTRIRVELPIGD